MTEAWHGTVMIVEDNLLFRQLFKASLKSRFPSVDVAEAGDLAEAWKRLKNCRPHAVFLDIGLPDGNGLDLAARIRNELPGTPVLICTSHDLPEYREAAERSGAVHFFCKQGLDWNALGDVLENVFQRPPVA